MAPHNYHPLPVVLKRAKEHAYGMLKAKNTLTCSAYSAVNQGHCHPRLIDVMQDQIQELTLTSRRFTIRYLESSRNILPRTSL